MPSLKPVVLIVLDGWGISTSEEGNAIRRAKLPTMDKLSAFYPVTALQASGISVGLPWGEVGNSEVGHMSLGAGKTIYQNLPRITLSIQDGTFFQNPAFVAATEKVKSSGGKLHVMGLFGNGPVHSHAEHLYALLKMAKVQQVEEVYLHLFTDGRDSAPTSGAKKLMELYEQIKIQGIGKIATIVGRNWAMDRNNNWDRVQKAYDMLTKGTGTRATDPVASLAHSYTQKITDEYIEPIVIEENDSPMALIQDGDAVIFFNYREDRAREITKAFVDPDFSEFKREKKLDIVFVTMTEYEKNIPVQVAFLPETITGGLGEILSNAGKKQLRAAETEKYAHVTYFFNGGREDKFEGEDRIVVPSPSVAKYDEAPEMSAGELTSKIIEAIHSGKYDFILINYANPDMVGHTGNEAASIKAVEFIDAKLAELIPEIIKAGGCALITADHGNVEEVKNLRTGGIDTEHSANPVPLWFVTPTNHRKKTQDEIFTQYDHIRGLLADISPTILEIMGIEKPKEMTGESLLKIIE